MDQDRGPRCQDAIQAILSNDVTVTVILVRVARLYLTLLLGTLYVDGNDRVSCHSEAEGRRISKVTGLKWLILGDSSLRYAPFRMT